MASVGWLRSRMDLRRLARTMAVYDPQSTVSIPVGLTTITAQQSLGIAVLANLSGAIFLFWPGGILPWIPLTMAAAGIALFVLGDRLPTGIVSTSAAVIGWCGMLTTVAATLFVLAVIAGVIVYVVYVVVRALVMLAMVIFCMVFVGSVVKGLGGSDP